MSGKRSSAEAAGAAADVIGLYRRHAQAFIDLRSTTLVERAWIDHFLDLVGQGGSVLDLGCGSGVPIAAYMARRGHPVTGVDGSPELLDAFARNVPEATRYLADMRTLSLGERFAGLLAWDSLFHLTQADQQRMLHVLARHAAPGAALLFNSGTADAISIGHFQGDALFHASLSPEAYRTLLGGLGFALVAHRETDADCGGRTVWLFRKLSA